MDKITPANFLSVLDSLEEGRERLIAEKVNGVVVLKIERKDKSGRAKLAPLSNMLTAKLNYEPVKPGWLAGNYLGEPTAADYRRRHDHKKAVNKAASEGRKAGNKELDKIKLVMAFLDETSGIPVSGGRDKLVMFTAGDFVIYTTTSFKPVKYTYKGGEMIHLRHEEEKFTPRTYSMLATGEVSPV